MNTRFCLRTWKRSYCSYKHALSSQLIRSRFIDYFIKEKDHVFIKSTPVPSYFDPSIPFINAGMCQFKRIFTGEEEIDCDKAANTQKCIRIGGKYNDLNLVGVDSYHHTFFEMLGNWSFGSYSKKEACAMALDLLTSAPYNISPNKLFVTYFAGDEMLSIPADNEVRDIWLQLGIPPDRILPFGIKENFWEMGDTGPCGTCTEIHVALDDSVSSRSDLVNKNNPLLAELWNIVFIKFNKTENSVEKLPKEFIDTGMGFERLTTLLQGKTSNYDTDLFIPLLDTISQISRAPKYKGLFDSKSLDSSYRCLADFSRMITVAISDSVFPDQNPKLKRVLRKALFLAKYKFDCKEPNLLLNELSNRVAEIYQDIFPEIGNNLSKIKLIVDNEYALVKSLIDNNFQNWNQKLTMYPVLNSFSFIEYPGLSVAFECLLHETKSMKKGDYIPAQLIHYLYDSHGLDKPVVEKLIEKLEFNVNWNEVEDCLGRAKEASRKLSRSSAFSILEKSKIKTDDSPVHSYTKNKDGSYNFPETRAKLMAVLANDCVLSVAEPSDELASEYSADVMVKNGDEVVLIFDKSNFFGGESGRIHDIGEITVLANDKNVRFNVVNVKTMKNIIAHHVQLCDDEGQTILKTGADAVLKLDAAHRINIMRNYSVIHLVLAALRDLYPLTYFKRFYMDSDRVKLTCRAYGKKFNLSEDKQFIEEKVAKYITDKISFERTIIPTGREALLSNNVNLTPGIVYPPANIQAVRLIDQNGKVILSELCSGVHLLNAEDLNGFQITSLKMKSSSDLNFHLRCGDNVHDISEGENILEDKCKTFIDRAKSLLNNDCVTIGEMIDFNDESLKYFYDIKYQIQSGKLELTPCVKNILLQMEALQKDITKQLEKFTRESVIRELSARIQREKGNQKFVVYSCLLNSTWFLHDSFKVDIIYRNKFPTMFFHYGNNKLSAVCYVPKAFVTQEFNAGVWLTSVLNNFSLEIIEEEDMINYCFSKHRVSDIKFKELITSLMETSARIAEEFLK